MQFGRADTTAAATRFFTWLIVCRQPLYVPIKHSSFTRRGGAEERTTPQLAEGASVSISHMGSGRWDTAKVTQGPISLNSLQIVCTYRRCRQHAPPRVAFLPGRPVSAQAIPPWFTVIGGGRSPCAGTIFIDEYKRRGRRQCVQQRHRVMLLASKPPLLETSPCRCCTHCPSHSIGARVGQQNSSRPRRTVPPE